MNTILLVEDDANLQASLRNFLQQEGFKVRVARSCAEAEKELKSQPSLIVLDWMLPDRQGIDFLREIRRQGLEVPVIFLTARTDLVDKVLGLETGASDYLTKPFEPKELAARIRVQLRGAVSGAAVDTILRGGEIEMDDVDKRVCYREKEVALTKMEYSLLKIFLENPNRVFSRDELLNRVWGYDSYPTTRTVDNHVLQLRQKFGETAFETLRGVGYRFKMTKK